MHPVFEKLKGQKDLLTPLLIVSEKNQGRIEEVVDLCRTFLSRTCVDHPDLLVFSPESGSKTYSMDTIRSLVQEAMLPPFEEKVRYFVLDQVDTMLPVHQNALLKVLEEHPPFAKFILISDSSAPLLPTVLSRLKKIFLEDEPSEKPPTPNFSLPFSEFHLEVQPLAETFSFVDMQGGEEVMHELDEKTLLWTIEGQKAQNLPIKKKHILEALYAKFKIENG